MMRAAGQKEYARKTNNAFANFERVADNLGLDRIEVYLDLLWGMIDQDEKQSRNVNYLKEIQND